ncbi:LysM peptidoglycan-binding domain-containing protein [Endozoicomonas sp. SM1973]|uniref:LysM peptidoglycan-binding domain-containing protein n=1 Tax=Spartinivicinus marinus TaxID=2994442 RepID=A0A853I9J5_9GAMM|nr:LysM peptidoglycan-binding domain-containing protein [Spartinivicinus marinus]MCX4026921.1 LysM peptidoglycan-binding domain-containing protein [Spartinivicinus marinus]NYZ66734.1 LysM peptidoglycan-binding domain-containing protein [Spartinivicinus marinus]
MRKSLLGVVFSCLVSFSTVAAENPIRADHPNSYTVKKGDTLWDIANRFLTKPWMWPAIWHVNPIIKNPHLIYPGDQINLVYIDGKPYLTIGKRGAGGVIKLSPKIRKTPIKSAIPAIPLNAINSFMDRSRIIDDEDVIEKAPYVISSRQERIINGVNDLIYARGEFKDDASAYGIFRRAERFTDPKTNEFLGVMVMDIGVGEIKDVANDIATINITESNSEIRIGDRMLETEERRLQPVFHPSSPKKDIEGEILAVVGGVNQIGQFDNVVINRGTRDGLETGNIMSITKKLVIKDHVTKQYVDMPPDEVGLLMIYRPFEKVSYAVVLKATQPIKTGDGVINP